MVWRGPSLYEKCQNLEALHNCAAISLDEENLGFGSDRSMNEEKGYESLKDGWKTEDPARMR